MKLGAFSISLSVADLEVSKTFYEKLGFTAFAGALDKNYLIMKNENSLVGLFQGMFEGNILTFNPGWDENANNLEEFNDIREIQQHLKGKGLRLRLRQTRLVTDLQVLWLLIPTGMSCFLISIVSSIAGGS